MRTHHERPRRTHAQRKQHQERPGKHTIFVTIDENETQLPPITTQGDDGPRGHDTDITPTVRPANNDTNGDA